MAGLAVTDSDFFEDFFVVAFTGSGTSTVIGDAERSTGHAEDVSVAASISVTATAEISQDDEDSNGVEALESARYSVNGEDEREGMAVTGDGGDAVECKSS